MTRPARLAAAGLLAVVALAGCGSTPVLAGSAAIVGDTRISTDELSRLVEQGLADPAAGSLAADRVGYQRDVLGRLITSDVVKQAADRAGVTVEPGDVDAQYAALEQSVGGADALREQAGAAGLTLERVRELARTRALTLALGSELVPGPVDDPALEQQRAEAVEQALTQTARDLTIRVNPRLGTWDGATLSVVERPDRGVSTPQAPDDGADGTLQPEPQG